jgi:hypothetical protein
MNKQNPSWEPVEEMRKFQDGGKRRRTRTDSGKARNLPSLPFEYWCKPCGNLVRLVVMTTRNVKQAVNPQYYSAFVRVRAEKEGWFPWQWADARAYAPVVVTRSGASTKEEWEAWRETELQRRRVEHNEMSRKAASAWLDQAGQRKLESKEAFSEAIKDFAEVMKQQNAQAAQAERKPRGANG